MAVVTRQSSLYRPDDNGLLDPVDTAGRLIIKNGVVTNAADDSANSTFRICDLPSYCILHSLSGFDVAAWGFAQVRVGTLTDNDALLSVAKSAGAVARPVQFGDTRTGKPLWEVLGLTEDPGGVIPIFAHAIAAATAAGSMRFEIAYLVR